MTRRSYAGGARPTTITAPISATSLSVTIADATGWPDTSTGECFATISRGEATEERVLCTRTGTTLTFASTAKRGVDGTTAQSHASGAAIEHTTAAVNDDEANAHVNASAAVHGLTGTVVGTTDVQTLTSKTVNLSNNSLTSTKAQFNAAMSDAEFATLDGVETLTNKTLTAPTVADLTNAQHDHSAANKGGSIPQGSVTGLTAALAAKATDSAVVHIAGTETITGAKTFTVKPVADNLPLIAAGSPSFVADGQLGYDTTNNVLSVRRPGPIFQPVWAIPSALAPTALSTSSTSGTTELVVASITSALAFAVTADATCQYPNLVKTVAGDGFWLRLYLDGVLVGQQFIEATAAVNAGGKTFTLPVTVSALGVLEWRLVRASGTGTAAFASGGFCWARMQG